MVTSIEQYDAGGGIALGAVFSVAMSGFLVAVARSQHPLDVGQHAE